MLLDFIFLCSRKTLFIFSFSRKSFRMQRMLRLLRWKYYMMKGALTKVMVLRANHSKNTSRYILIVILDHMLY